METPWPTKRTMPSFSEATTELAERHERGDALDGGPLGIAEEGGVSAVLGELEVGDGTGGEPLAQAAHQRLLGLGGLTPALAAGGDGDGAGERDELPESPAGRPHRATAAWSTAADSPVHPESPRRRLRDLNPPGKSGAGAGGVGLAASGLRDPARQRRKEPEDHVGGLVLAPRRVRLAGHVPVERAQRGVPAAARTPGPAGAPAPPAPPGTRRRRLHVALHAGDLPREEHPRLRLERQVLGRAAAASR